MEWTSINDELPPLKEDVLFCCQIDDTFTFISIGQYCGHKTEGNAVVMDANDSDDWEPCSHWMPLPKQPKHHKPKE